METVMKEPWTSPRGHEYECVFMDFTTFTSLPSPKKLIRAKCTKCRGELTFYGEKFLTENGHRVDWEGFMEKFTLFDKRVTPCEKV